MECVAAGLLIVGVVTEPTANAAKNKNKGTVKKEAIGKTTEGKAVEAYTLVNKNRLKARIINYGAMLTEMHVPAKNGQFGEIVLGLYLINI